jgi:phospholipid-binding lipoprotein MlaA
MRQCALALAGALVLLSSCATAPTDPAALAVYKSNNDPLEPLNRKFFAFNEGLDRMIIKPVAQGYLRALPRSARDSVRNFVWNLNDPVVCANDLLQGRFGAAGSSALRFLLDSTAGVVGLIDVASEDGLKRQTGDLGQTFHVWGLPEGPYLVIPVLGPSNPRDGVGMGLQTYLSPFRYVAINNNFPGWATYSPQVAGGVDERSRAIDTLDALKKGAVDYYASLRSLFRQNRTAELEGGPSAPIQEGLYDDPDSAAPQKSGDAGKVSR